jgi:hypothetical protein
MIFKCGTNDKNITIASYDLKYQGIYNDKNNNKNYEAIWDSKTQEFSVNTNKVVEDYESESTNDTDNESEEED